jgi:hypothetical protein
MNNTIVFLLAIICCSLLSSQVYSFSPSSGSSSTQRRRGLSTSNVNFNSRSTTHLFSSIPPRDKQAEIAALEERLRQLKEEQDGGGITEEQQRQQILSEAAATLTPDELAALQKISEESDDSIMFSEKWKEDASSVNGGEGEGIMGSIKTAGLALGLILFLGLFSQIPVGESDLQKYQDIKGSTSRIDLGDLNPGVRVQ